MAPLAQKLNLIANTVEAYASRALTGESSSFLQSRDGKTFSVVDVLVEDGRHVADTGLMVKVEGDFVVIEHDMNDKPLVDALVQAGIPRAQIILAYAGEPIPDSV